MNRDTIPQKIYDALKDLEVNGEVDKKQMIKDLYEKNDIYVSRSFDVCFVAAKKRLDPKTFKSMNGKKIVRTT